jgi:hypothetical protein
MRSATLSFSTKDSHIEPFMDCSGIGGKAEVKHTDVLLVLSQPDDLLR